MKAFKEKIRDLFDDYEKLVTRKNIPSTGIFLRVTRNWSLVRIYLLKVEMEFSHVINILF